MFKDDDGTSLGDGHNSNHKPFVKYQPDEITKQSIEELKRDLEINKPKILDYRRKGLTPFDVKVMITLFVFLATFILLSGLLLKNIVSKQGSSVTIKNATGFVTLQDGSSLIQLKDGRVFHCEVKE